MRAPVGRRLAVWRAVAREVAAVALSLPLALRGHVHAPWRRYRFAEPVAPTEQRPGSILNRARWLAYDTQWRVWAEQVTRQQLTEAIAAEQLRGKFRPMRPGSTAHARALALRAAARREYVAAARGDDTHAEAAAYDVMRAAEVLAEVTADIDLEAPHTVDTQRGEQAAEVSRVDAMLERRARRRHRQAMPAEVRAVLTLHHAPGAPGARASARP